MGVIVIRLTWALPYEKNVSAKRRDAYLEVLCSLWYNGSAQTNDIIIGIPQ